MSIFFVTVGGSFQPIVTAVKSLQPERVVFICSVGPKGTDKQVTGSGTPCEVRRGEVTERLPNIPTQLGLGDRFDPVRDLVRLEHPDDLGDCYTTIAAKVREVKQSASTATLKADYTGGTKTMSAALALVGLDFGVTLHVTTGTRLNIVKLERGELTGAVSVAGVSAQRFLDGDLPELQRTYNYVAAREVVTRLLVTGGLDAKMRSTLQRLADLCAAFNAWDSFDHGEAWAHLEPYMADPVVRPLGVFLRQVIGSRAQLDPDFSAAGGINGHGFELVQDLINNAERRAAQHRFDDAVGRLYRALELLAQVRLYRVFGLKTGALEVEKLPETLRATYETKRDSAGRVVVALLESYELLTELGDPLGDYFAKAVGAVKDSLQVRNASLFAHGFRPIAEPEYLKFKNVVVPFIEHGLALETQGTRSPQFPATF